MKEQKMYSIVMRHLSGIQKGIQHSHSATLYGYKYHDTKEYKRWMTKDLNMVVLQAVTTDQLKDAVKKLKDCKIKVVEFREPDLDNALTSITFLLDERVWNKDKYSTDGLLPHKELLENPNFLDLRSMLKQFTLATN